VERALAKDPRSRFGSAAEMGSALLGGPVAGDVREPSASTVTQQLPAQSSRPTRTGRWRWLPSAVGLLAVVLAIAVAYVLLRGDDELDGTANPDPEAAAEADTGTVEPTEPQPGEVADADGLPSDLDGLITTVAAADQTGDKTDSLLDKLRELAADPDDGEARKLIEEVGKWTAEGELDPEVGQVTIAVLEEQSRPGDPELAEVSGLFAEVSSDSPAWGSKAGNLAADLRKLLDTDEPGQRKQQARKLGDELDEWISKGEIDAERGDRAQDALTALQ
jgi:hypothetical protein